MNIIRSMSRLLSLALLALVSQGCGGTTGAAGIIGSYDVQISKDGKSDPDIMSISEGAGGTVLFTFITGITTDPMGPNAGGLRGTVSGTEVKIEPQPAHIAHSTGALDGTLMAQGTIMPDGSTVSLVITYAPVNLADATTLEYTVEGSKL